MTNPLSNSQDSTVKNIWFSLPVFVIQVLKSGFFLLVFGVIFIVLIKFHFVTDYVIPPNPDPLPFAGGAIVLVALTLMGIPLIPAAAAGVAIWWLVQDFFF